MDPAFLEDVVEVHTTPVDPYAVIALCHGVGCDSWIASAHIVLYQEDL
jgi:hypothetical protein